MIHIYKKGKDESKPTLLLLHGTGGTEESLLALAAMIDPDTSILSVRGNVLENGMPRFFKRFAEGLLDEDDLRFRTNELNEFLRDAAEKYEFDRDNVVAIGYSNGANIAASQLYFDKTALKGAILHHPMPPFKALKPVDLTDIPVFIGAGTNDPLIPMEETEKLVDLLKEANANVSLHWENLGHQLSQTEVEAAKEWYGEYFVKA